MKGFILKSSVNIFLMLFILFQLASCDQERKDRLVKAVNWDARKAEGFDATGMRNEQSYLSVYSEIFDHTDETTHLLTATVSIRNTSLTDSLFLTAADYYNTGGEKIRSYISQPVYLLPLETIEIVIPREDAEGGSGANFIFDWSVRSGTHEPVFEAVMIWTTGNQGISFMSRGVKL